MRLWGAQKCCRFTAPEKSTLAYIWRKRILIFSNSGDIAIGRFVHTMLFWTCAFVECCLFIQSFWSFHGYERFKRSVSSFLGRYNIPNGIQIVSQPVSKPQVNTVQRYTGGLCRGLVVTADPGLHGSVHNSTRSHTRHTNTNIDSGMTYSDIESGTT